MLAGLFTPTNLLIPTTPVAADTPFPLAESEESEGRSDYRNAPQSTYFSRRQSVIDPTLVSFHTLRACMTLKYWHSPCTSVSFWIKYYISSLHRLIAENPPPCNEYYLMQSCSKEASQI